MTRLAMLAVLAVCSSACGARVLEVKTARGGFCLMCFDKPDRVDVDRLLTPSPRVVVAK